MSIVEKLTEGIVRRDLAKEGAALLNKWERTGLLEGLNSDYAKNNMASLLENQAKELLREASLMSSGDVEGFAAVAFPIVRRVFGSLIANDLVSVQPMSLPSGLIFFLDFKFAEDAKGLGNHRTDSLDYDQGDSIYGQGIIGSQLTGGVSINEDKQPYGFQTGFSSATGSATFSASANTTTHVSGGAVLAGQRGDGSTMDKLLRFDPDIASASYVAVYKASAGGLTSKQADITEAGLANLVFSSSAGGLNQINGNGSTIGIGDNHVSGTLVRRLVQYSGSSRDNILLPFVCSADPGTLADADLTAVVGSSLEFIIADNFVTGGALGSVAGDDTWGLEASSDIPEIEIKVDSISVTARTKKLKAKWSPELGQDLNAYHNLDAEVELTSILSEQIALEIDREILADLIKGAKAATYYWSRSPGLFVNKVTGSPTVDSSAIAPDFTGNVSEWYETLIETINDVSAQIHRKTLRGGANFLVCGPEVANILEFTSGFRANVSHADEKGTVGAVNVGSISKKFDVMVDPYFPRNVVLVGRKGNSFLESGYVYAPYVPLQVTPTIFGTEDFVPRKGVMTRYAKKMVRPDMYGLVIVRGLLGDDQVT
jgi:hypothetical protein